MTGASPALDGTGRGWAWRGATRGDRLEAPLPRGIAAEVPAPRDRQLLNEIIFEELVNGVLTESSRQRYVRVIEGLAERGCDAVALVCTEIPLLVTPEVSPLPTLDSTRLLARAAFDVCIGDRALPTWRGGPVRD